MNNKMRMTSRQIRNEALYRLTGIEEEDRPFVKLLQYLIAYDEAIDQGSRTEGRRIIEPMASMLFDKDISLI